MLLIPIHIGMHCATVIVDITNHKIGYYDSLMIKVSTCLSTIRYVDKPCTGTALCADLNNRSVSPIHHAIVIGTT